MERITAAQIAEGRASSRFIVSKFFWSPGRRCNNLWVFSLVVPIGFIVLRLGEILPTFKISSLKRRTSSISKEINADRRVLLGAMFGSLAAGVVAVSFLPHARSRRTRYNAGKVAGELNSGPDRKVSKGHGKLTEKEEEHARTKVGPPARTTINGPEKKTLQLLRSSGRSHAIAYLKRKIYKNGKMINRSKDLRLYDLLAGLSIRYGDQATLEELRSSLGQSLQSTATQAKGVPRIVEQGKTNPRDYHLRGWISERVEKWAQPNSRWKREWIAPARSWNGIDISRALP